MVYDLSQLTGQQVGNYTLGKLLGAGGMGAVYLSEQRTARNRKVAVKILRAGETPSERRLVDREMAFMVELEHLHILTVYETGIEDRLQLNYIVMRYFPQGDLNALFKQYDPVPEQRVLEIMKQVTDALQHTHEKQIIHRDIKLENIFLDADGNAYVGDFGFARSTRKDISHSTTGTVKGTPYYMSPEQIMASSVIDRRTDIYALGVLVFRLLSGQFPFNALQDSAVYMKHMSEAPPLITDVNPALPDRLNDVLRKALAKSPDERYASTVDFMTALRQSFETVSPSRSQHIDVEDDLLIMSPVAWTDPAVIQDYTERVTDIIGEPFAWQRIPAGQVTLKSGGQHAVSAFLMATYPVTVSQFRSFTESSTGYNHEQAWRFNPEAKSWWLQYSYRQEKYFPDGDDHPRTHVTLYEALAFCHWLAAQTDLEIMLPLETQWQWAAQGDTGQRYPWPGNLSTAYCNYRKSNHRGTTPVTHYTQGSSPFGVMDMSGNVREWCLPIDPEADRRYPVRGGSWGVEDAQRLRVDYQDAVFPNTREATLGFRIICSVVERSSLKFTDSMLTGPDETIPD